LFELVVNLGDDVPELLGELLEMLELFEGEHTINRVAMLLPQVGVGLTLRSLDFVLLSLLALFLGVVVASSAFNCLGLHGLCVVSRLT
jgi:hypothetical protein